MKTRPVLERLEEKRLPSAGLWTTPFLNPRASFQPGGSMTLHPVDASGPLRTVGDCPRNRPGRTRLGTFDLIPDSGTLVPPFVQVRASSATPVPGATYSLAFLTVRNGTTRAFNAQSGFAVKVAGQPTAQPFPMGSQQWKPGEVLVFYALTKDTFPPSFTFDFAGSKQERPSNIYFNIRYNPSTFPGELNAIVARSVGARYRLV
jgi:hypothetical protein